MVSVLEFISSCAISLENASGIIQYNSINKSNLN